MSLKPIPKALPSVSRIDALLHATKFIGNPISEFQRYSQKYGDTFHFFMAGIRPSIVSAHPEIVQHILQKNHRNYTKSKFQTNVLSKYVGKGLLTSTGDHWLRQRRLIQPGFHKKRIQSLTQLMLEQIDHSMKKVKSSWVHDETLDVHKLMGQLTFNIIGKTLFSESIENDELKEMSRFITTFQNFVIKEARLPFMIPWYKVTGQIEAHISLAQKVREMIGRVLDQRKKDRKSNEDLLQMFLDAQYEDSGEGMTREQLIDECLILFVAGHETSANALTWALAILGQNEDAKQSVLHEIPNHHSDDPASFPFTTNVIQEAMRMYPPAWLIDRIALEDDQIAGLEVTAGTVFLLDVYGLHHHPSVWQNPFEFSPDRFNDISSNQDMKKSYYPFGAGPRMCIGNHFAMQEMQLIVSRFLSNFPNYKLQGNMPFLQPMITLRPKGNVLLKLT